jgi:hypothetical protein
MVTIDLSDVEFLDPRALWEIDGHATGAGAVIHLADYPPAVDHLSVTSVSNDSGCR